MNLHTLQPRPGAKHRVKRLGNGESSGKGKTCGKGHKGQKARSGGSIRLGFEGGQMPLIRRIPKRGFNNTDFKTRFAVVNLDALNAFDNGATVDEAALLASGLIRRPYDAVKILGSGELKKKLNVTVTKASESAKAAIEKAGGSLSLK
jgi:large subunit ribosomal protein L15